MAVKAIFYIQSVTKQANGYGVIKAQPAAKGPYAKWSVYTPTGSFEITSANPDATAWFEARLGKDVAFTIDDPTENDLLP